MIRIGNIYDIQAVDELEYFIDSMDDMNQEMLQETRDEIAPDALAELQSDPGEVKYPIEWASDKQRKFVMAKLRRENNLPYQRTDKLRNMWVVEVRGRAIVIENISSIAKYVYGSLAQDRSAALRFQQPFHKNTEWQPATDTASFWLDAATEIYMDKFDERLRDFATGNIRRRAFTGGRRRR